MPLDWVTPDLAGLESAKSRQSFSQLFIAVKPRERVFEHRV
jgi:hypothetical protein